MSKLYEEIKKVITEETYPGETHRNVEGIPLAADRIEKIVINAQIELLKEILADDKDFPVTRKLKDLQKQLEQ